MRITSTLKRVTYLPVLTKANDLSVMTGSYPVKSVCYSKIRQGAEFYPRITHNTRIGSTATGILIDKILLNPRKAFGSINFVKRNPKAQSGISCTIDLGVTVHNNHSPLNIVAFIY